MESQVEAPILWQPERERAAASRLQQFCRQVEAESGCSLPKYQDLWQWSVDHPGPFWRKVWDFGEVIGQPGTEVLHHGEAMPGARWFPQAKLNFAENLLRRDDDHTALIFRREDGFRRTLSFSELREQVRLLQGALRQAGLQPGDRVAAFLPNLPEAIIGMLAVASLGGIWSSCSPDFGVAGILDRFGQIEPRWLLVTDGYLYKGKSFDSLEKVEAIQKALPSLQGTVVVPYMNSSPSLNSLPNTYSWQDFLAQGHEAELEFPAFPFDQPLYILFSSGTTGKPKCIVHGAGGTLLQHLKEHQLHTDLGRQDRLFYFTTTGWMMWNWLVTGLASGSTLVLFEGNPFHPGPEALWQLVAEEKVTVFGTSAKYLDAVKKSGLAPRQHFDLTALRAILSTGSPLVPESFDFVYQEVKSDLQLASIAGGTDIVSCFVLGAPSEPVRRGEIQVRGLGMAVDVFDPDGRALRNQPGELVCTRPFPSMPVSFWNDPEGQRYRSAYFERFPGIWHHGDWVSLMSTGGMVIHGRSDATLNPGGIRIGTAEIYRQVEQIDQLEESIVVGQDTGDGDQRIVLFVRLRPGLSLTEALQDQIRRRIRSNATPRHVPAVIAQVQDIPRTRSGKISELAVRDVLHGREVKNTEALANPDALEEYRQRPELAL
ncbi:MAG: acetoacetate--CoA ligase [Planctomycetota bacterium]|nr:MAG: acetoacetate--CoA ligase [Planctomycetota bacterium]